MDQVSKRIVRFLPSMTDVAFTMPIVFLFARLEGAKTLLGDGDTGWHIRTGEWMLDHGQVPYRDLFSFTKPDQPWFAWEWLWDLVFGWMHRQWGMAAVVVASMLVLCATFALLYRLVRRKCDNVLVAIGVVFLACASSSIHWLARPHLFSFLFLLIFYWLLEKAHDGQVRALWWLPALTVVWTNIHGGFLAGIVLAGTYAAGELAQWALEPEREARRAALARSKPYIIAAIACFAATFVNPYSYRLHVHMFRFLQDPSIYRTVVEYFAFSFQDPVARFFEPLAFLGGLAALWDVYRRRYVYALVVFSWLHLALFSVRNVPLFAILAAPTTARAINELIGALASARIAAWIRNAADRFSGFTSGFEAFDSAARWPVASAAAALAVGWLLFLPAPGAEFRCAYDPGSYPVKALPVVRSSAGPVFSDDEWGDFLIYTLYPSRKVFIDGRADFYGSDFDRRYLNTINAKHQWQETLARYGVQTVLLQVNAPLAGALKESRRWRVVYDDGNAIVFRSASAGPAVAGQTATEPPQASAAKGGGDFRDRRMTITNHTQPTVKNPYARREPS